MQYAEFSVPHAQLPAALFLRTTAPRVHSQEALNALRIAVSEHSLAHDFLQAHMPGAKIHPVGDLREALIAVENNEADAALIPAGRGRRALLENPLPHVAESDFVPAGLHYNTHFAVPRGRSELLYELNLGLHALRENGTYDRLYAKWIDPSEQPFAAWRDLRAHWLTLTLIAAALTAVFLVQRRLLRRLRRQTEALKTSEERLALALEGSEDAFWDWDIVNGRVYRGHRWTEILADPANEIASQIDGLRDHVHPDDLDRFEQFKRSLIRDGQARTEYRLRAQDGSWRWIFDRGKVVARGPDQQPIRITGAATDITLRKRIEEALVRSQALLEQTQQAAGMGGWEYDLRTRTIFWTKETWRIHALPPSEDSLPEERVFEFFTPSSREVLTAALARATNEGQPFDLELELVTAEHRPVWVRYIGRVELAGEKVVRVFGSIQDITLNKKADEERRKLQLKMLEAQKLESLGVLAGGIAHDFNNLLTVIMGNASLARVTNGAASAEALEHIETAANRAADLCRQMLSYAGKSRFSLEKHNLNSLIEDTTHLFKTSIAKNAALEFALSSEPLFVEIDASQIRQVIMNLVINASDAIGTAPGNIRIRSATAHITAEQLRDARIGQERPPGEYITLEVEDDGCGMSAETITRIFDPFFTTKFTGRGLGLAAVLGIVRAHRGAFFAFFVRSVLGKGTTFTLALPPASGPTPATPAPVRPVTRENKAEGTILVVDDEPQVRKIAASILEKHGYTVALAADGYEALALALAHGMSFKAVLLDLTMPGIDGPATLRELRALSKTVPVLIMSGYSETDARKQIIAAPLVGFIPKPFAHEDLINKMQALIAEATDLAPSPGQPR
jgi:PAS domain S-box